MLHHFDLISPRGFIALLCLTACAGGCPVNAPPTLPGPAAFPVGQAPHFPTTEVDAQPSLAEADAAQEFSPSPEATAEALPEAAAPDAIGEEASPPPAGPDPGNCCAVRLGETGCEVAEIEACVCAADPFCCNTEWDNLCVEGVTGACGVACGGGPIGGDDTFVELDCEIAGTPLAAGQDWGPAPQGGAIVACFEVRNGEAVARAGEVAYSAIPVPQALALTSAANLIVVGAGNLRVPAQFDVIARWGGVVDDPALPIRWLEVSVPAEVAAQSANGYELRQAAGPSPAADPGPVTVKSQGGMHLVDTGVASFLLDPALPGLLRQVEVDTAGGSQEVYAYAAQDGMGPRLELAGKILGNAAGAAGKVVLDAGGFSLVELGPVKVVVAQRGHFVGAGGSTLCKLDGADGEVAPYERFGYTLGLTFTRGQPGIELSYHFVNECGDGYSGPWTDDAIEVGRVSFDLPVALGGAAPQAVYAGGAAIAAADGTGELVVEQRLGGGTPWKRRARVTLGGAELEAGEGFESPLVGLAGNALAATAQMPWMRYREPQALAAGGDRLSLQLVSEPTRVAEARGIWGAGRFDFLPMGGGLDLPALEVARARGRAALERGLLVRASRAAVNAAGVLPSLGLDAPSTLRDAYLTRMNSLHAATVGPQWEKSKTYGSQVWPDVPANSAPVGAPAENLVEMNYWNGSRNELLEYLRRGDVKWAWDWALPQTWYQLHSAFANFGDRTHTNRNGFALTSGGCGWDQGCYEEATPTQPSGHWNRSGLGSDDYTYTHGDLGYVVRPSFALMRRFAAAGRTAIDRYVDDEAQRGVFVSARDVYRQVVQHWVHLANCAEFVPGAEGKACHAKLLAILEELAEDNFKGGVMCERDDPKKEVDWNFQTVAADPKKCGVPQQFMQNALMLPFFHRVYRNYGDVGGTLKKMLVGAMWRYYVHGMGLPVEERPKSVADPGRPAIPTDDLATWTNALVYELTADRTSVASCSVAPVDAELYDGQGNVKYCALHPDTDPGVLASSEDAMLFPNRPQTVAMLLMSHQLDPSLRVCEVGKTALSDPSFLGYWLDYDVGAGWTKGPAQMMQGMAFGLGVFDTCKDP